jgi:hypothetical protein
MVVVLTSLGATTFMVIGKKYRLVHQTASWHEALLTAEAGIDLAMNEIRKELRKEGDGFQSWTQVAGSTTSAIKLQDQQIVRRGEGGTLSWAEVTVDRPSSLNDTLPPGSEPWYRIRSTGYCDVPGSATVAGDSDDVKLHKLQLKRDPKTGNLLSKPRAARTIEVIAAPWGGFRVALLGDETIDMTNHNIVVDSYDSRDSDKSTNGRYDPAKRQWNGDIATNGNILNAGSAHIYGTASTNSGAVINDSNVTGNYTNDPARIRDDFYQELIPITAPSDPKTPGTPDFINNTTVLTASPGAPTNVILSGLNLSGPKTLTIQGAADGSETFIQIVVTGNISLSGQAQIVLGPGVYARIFVQGDADITGNGVFNPNSCLNLQVYGCDKPRNADGKVTSYGQMKIAGNGGFNGTVYAPTYDIEIKGGGNADTVYGAFVGHKIFMNGVQSVHYDEALRDGGLITAYNIVSWFEDEM